MATKKKQVGVEAIIELQEQGVIEVFIVGTSPLIFHNFSPRAKSEFLFPSVKPSNAELAKKLKHDPVQEFRDSFYYMTRKHKTFIGMPSIAFKTSIGTAALETAGVHKTNVMRNTSVYGDMVNVYGIPNLGMSWHGVAGHGAGNSG